MNKHQTDHLVNHYGAQSTDINKQSIAESFGASASSYDSGAALQRSVGNKLLELTKACDKGILLDLGTGPGYFTSALSDRSQQVIGLDIATPMLQFAQARNQQIDCWWLAGDAENLPLANECVSGVFSSLMLQWTHDLAQALAESQRVLQVTGQIAFTTLLNGTLSELASAWSRVDQHQHVNSFMDLGQIEQIINHSGFKLCHMELKPQVVWYDSVVGLMKDLKAIGASQTAHAQRGLMGKSQLQALKQGYEPYRCNGKLPATYQVLYVVLEKI
ncbi:MAG: malonyl-ACP O-methyltransferase BioC [Gammaproteobacteria bacterium]|nr:malonyl-ACP O-methyltransferase BioC [Gammaproteobacteria bacterium]